MSPDEKSLRKNVLYFYWIVALRWGLFGVPISVLFFVGNGLSLKEVFILQAVFGLCIALFEVPSGYASDVYSRKTCFLIGSIANAIGAVVIACSTLFWWFLLGQVLMAIGASFISGTDSAFLFDTLKSLDDEESYQGIESKGVAISRLSEAIAGICGAAVATWDLRYPFVLRALTLLVLVIIAFQLREPTIEREHAKPKSFSDFWVRTKGVLVRSPIIYWIIIYSGLISSFCFILMWLSQPYMQDLGIPILTFGVIWAGFQLCSSLAAWYVARVDLTSGFEFTLLWISLLLLSSYLLMGTVGTLIGLLGIIPAHLARGAFLPLIKSYLNPLLPSEVRATVLSVNSLVGRCIYAGLSPLVGYLLELFTFSEAVVTSGCFYFILCALAIWKFRESASASDSIEELS